MAYDAGCETRLGKAPGMVRDIGKTLRIDATAHIVPARVYAQFQTMTALIGTLTRQLQIAHERIRELEQGLTL